MNSVHFSLISVAVLFASCHEKCDYITEESISGFCVRTIRTYPDCNDVTTYSAKIFYDEVLLREEEMKNGKPNGDWIYHSWDNASRQVGRYKNGRRTQSIRYHYDGKTVWYNSVFINDSVVKEFQYYPNGKIASQGNSINGYSTGQWIIYDSLHLTKSIGNFVPISVSETTKAINPVTLEETYQITKSNGEKDGTWTICDIHGNILKTEEYAKGEKIDPAMK